MSQYTFRSTENPEYEIIVGWESWGASYYCIVSDLSIDEEEASPWGIFSEGTEGNGDQILTVEQLSRILINYGVIPTDIVNYLKEDPVKEPPQPTSAYSSEEDIFVNAPKSIRFNKSRFLWIIISAFFAFSPSIYTALLKANIISKIDDNSLLKIKKIYLIFTLFAIIMIPVIVRSNRLDNE